MALGGTSQTPSQLEHDAIASVRADRWVRSLLGMGVAFVALNLAMWTAPASMIETWWRSETFAHGFLIAPISFWLVWRKRADLAGLIPTPFYWGLFTLAGAGFGWLLGRVVDVLVIQQLAYVMAIQALVLAFLGWRIACRILFPLAFLFFAVPIGEGLIPPLMNFTAEFTVTLLRFTGIPVFSEGTFFSIPSGNWSVVEGCSGVRYLIASVTLGTVYAYLNYGSPWRRIVFVMVSIATPIIANGLRAYMIVMIAHLSDMTLALGVDHYIYGWVFFGLVMLLMFWIGSFWAEEDAQGTDQNRPVPTDHQVGSTRGARSIVTVTVAALAIIAVWPAWASYALRERSFDYRLEVPASTGEWQALAQPFTDWQPDYKSPGTQLMAFYTSAGGQGEVGLFLPVYVEERQGAELINSQNYLVRQKHPEWRHVGRGLISSPAASIGNPVRQGVLRGPGQNLLVWRWHWVQGRETSNDYLAKAFQAFERLLGRAPVSADIVLFTQFDENIDQAAARLEVFADQMLPGVRGALAGAGPTRGGE